jgi:hypothetical protein
MFMFLTKVVLWFVPDASLNPAISSARKVAFQIRDPSTGSSKVGLVFDVVPFSHPSSSSTPSIVPGARCQCNEMTSIRTNQELSAVYTTVHGFSRESYN